MQRTAIVLTVASGLLLTACTSEQHQLGASGAPLLVNGPFQMIAQHSGKCLEVSGGSGGALQKTCSAQAAGQQWQLRAAGSSNQIVSVADPTKCLNIASASTTPGGPVVLG